MLKKIGDLFFKNLGLKILALIISIILSCRPCRLQTLYSIRVHFANTLFA